MCVAPCWAPVTDTSLFCLYRFGLGKATVNTNNLTLGSLFPTPYPVPQHTHL